MKCSASRWTVTLAAVPPGWITGTSYIDGNKMYVHEGHPVHTRNVPVFPTEYSAKSWAKKNIVPFQNILSPIAKFQNAPLNLGRWNSFSFARRRRGDLDFKMEIH